MNGVEVEIQNHEDGIRSNKLERTHRQTEKETDRDTDKHTDTQRGIQTDRHTDEHTDRLQQRYKFHSNIHMKRIVAIMGLTYPPSL